MFPTLFKIGPVIIRTYGVLVAVAFFAGFLLLYKEARKKNFYADKILDLELIILVSALIGARTLHVLVNLDFYSKNLLDIFFIWRGGLAFYGGLILAIPASWIFIVRNKIPFWKTADLVGPYIALGQSIGRIGCFFNGCCFGKYIGTTAYRHPTQLYASMALISIFIFLKLIQKKASFNGFIFGLYLVLYSVQRFAIDFLRADTPRYLFNLTVSQIISLIILATAGIVIGKAWKR